MWHLRGDEKCMQNSGRIILRDQLSDLGVNGSTGISGYGPTGGACENNTQPSVSLQGA
jgi:hypothetical protein